MKTGSNHKNADMFKTLVAIFMKICTFMGVFITKLYTFISVSMTNRIKMLSGPVIKIV